MAELATPNTDRYSMAELMAVVMSRQLAENDGQLGGVGAAAAIPMAAIRLATLTVAPNIYWFCGSSGAFNPKFDTLPKTSADPRAFVRAEATQKMHDVVDMGGSGKWDFGFHGGLQIDRFGNCNLIGVGPYEKMFVRGPGAVGLPWAGSIRNGYIFSWHINPKIFVEKVDYMCGPGWVRGGDSRWEHLRRTSDGPKRVFTPIAIFDFEPETRYMRLLSVHPGYTVEDVKAQLGFELLIHPDLHETEAPTDFELQVLRRQVDRDGLLKTFALTVG